jgi:hypothetical protein
VSRIVEGAVRGVVGAMAMSGLRSLMRDAGLMEEEPPRALVKRFSPLSRLRPTGPNRVTVELAHWGVGAGGGIVFAALPDALRARRWVGPMYGIAIWLSFDAVIAPALGVKHAESRPVRQRIALAADHTLYGLVLAEPRPRPPDAEVAV